MSKKVLTFDRFKAGYMEQLRQAVESSNGNMKRDTVVGWDTLWCYVPVKKAARLYVNCDEVGGGRYVMSTVNLFEGEGYEYRDDGYLS